MWRLGVVAALGVALTAGGMPTALAATEPQVWQGTAFLTKVSSTCATTANTNVGDSFTAVFRPAIASVQNAPEGLSLTSFRTVQLYQSASAADLLRGTGTGTIVVLNSHGETLSTSAGSAPSIPYTLNFKPATIALATATVTLTGKITNFFGVTGCNVSLTAAMDRRVD